LKNLKTVKFCETFDGIFDLLNTRSAKAPENRRSISEESYKMTLIKIDHYIDYIKSIEVEYVDKKGRTHRCPIVKHPSRETGFIGLLLDLESLRGLIYDIIIGPKSTISQPQKPVSIPKEVTPYYHCQDLLEQLFSAVRGRNGFNRNPTALQFKYSLRAILTHAEIRIANGNTEILENIPVLRKKDKITGLYFFYIMTKI
jgi:hypothetical protein